MTKSCPGCKGYICVMAQVCENEGQLAAVSCTHTPHSHYSFRGVFFIIALLFVDTVVGGHTSLIAFCRHSQGGLILEVFPNAIIDRSRHFMTHQCSCSSFSMLTECNL